MLCDFIILLSVDRPSILTNYDQMKHVSYFIGQLDISYFLILPSILIGQLDDMTKYIDRPTQC